MDAHHCADGRQAGRPWAPTEPGRLIGRGHAAGDFLEAWRWTVLHFDSGHLRVRAHLADQLKNPRGQLFGGFTPTYVDLVAVLTVLGPSPDADAPWLATTALHVDYFEPLYGPHFVVEGIRDRQRGRLHHIRVSFSRNDELAAVASATLLEVQTTT